MNSEVELLTSRGHTIIEYYVNNTSITGTAKKIAALLNMVFSIKHYVQLRKALREHKPDVVHLHNFFPLLSPSVIYAANHERVPLVMTLHNFRTICPTATLMHAGAITEESIEAGPWWALKHRVYRGSYVGTLGLCAMISIHKALGTWRRANTLITLTKFARKMMIRSGIADAEQIVVKPNFADAFHAQSIREPYMLYVGRFSPEKGVDVLLDACRRTQHRCVIATPQYDGNPLLPPNVELHQGVTRDGVIGLMQKASCLVVPSTCYEGLPMVVVEAYSTATPVVCSRLGGLEEIVKDGKTGLHFEPGNSQDLLNAIDHLINTPELVNKLGAGALLEYQEKYRAETNASQLEHIYQEAKKKSQ